MAECQTPFTLKETNDTVPCSKCPNCLKRRESGWSFRLMEELKVSSSAYFITLTYDTQYVPITTNRFMSLFKKDVQLFFKRLRKLNNEKIKYYAAGEYGSQTRRPHYHIILFNAVVETIQAAWPLGYIHYGFDVGEASVGYTLKYISKPKWKPMHSRDDRQPEFALMSKGLGAAYIRRTTIAFHKVKKKVNGHKVLDTEHNRMYLPLSDGKKIAMPRYYKEKIYSKIERQVIGKATRQQMLLRQQMEKLPENYYRNQMESYKSAVRKLANDAKKRNAV